MLQEKITQTAGRDALGVLRGLAEGLGGVQYRERGGGTG